MTPLTDWMTTPAVGLTRRAPLADAARLLIAARVRQLVITDDDGFLAGIAADSAVFRYGDLRGSDWVPHHPADVALTVSAALRPAPWAARDSRFDDALRSLILSGAGALVVVDAERRPCGVLSESDALDHAYHRIPRAIRVLDLYQPSPYVVGPDDALHAAWALMEFHGFRHLPVVHGGSLVGVISHRDLEEANADLDMHGRVGPRMSPATETVRPWAAAADAADTLRRQRIGCLPVVDGERLVGLITSTDLLRALLHGRRH